MIYIPFKQLQVGGNFHLNGNWYRKRSTRTAEIIRPERFQDTWFYFSSNESIGIKPC